MNKINNLDRAIIYGLLKEYKKQFDNDELCISDIISSENNEYWAQFLSEDLYNQKYILYINSKLTHMSKKFIRRTLFHEFTHLADSLQFLKCDIFLFKHIMVTYSEFHASEVEMLELLKDIAHPITLNSRINKDECINDFMEKAFSNILKDLKETIRKNTCIKVKSLYYFCGYMKALNNYGLNYVFNKMAFPKGLIIPCNEIINSLIYKDSNDYCKIAKDYVKLKNAIIEEQKNQYNPNYYKKRNFSIFELIKNLKNKL